MHSSRPRPWLFHVVSEHITLPSRQYQLPTKVFLYYFDAKQGYSLANAKKLNQSFIIDGQCLNVVGDVALTRDVELLTFVQISGLLTKVVKLRREELVTLAILADFRAATTKRAGTQVRFERRMASVQQRNAELKATLDEEKTRKAVLDANNLKTLKQKQSRELQRLREKLVTAAKKAEERHAKELRHLRQRLVSADAKLESLTFAYHIKPTTTKLKHGYKTRLSIGSRTDTGFKA
ncbi:hypothetical protein K439DRAFT_1118384 [Ramaria rubella]|nr:hypothetical protein K439DRAFT_1118384 [Ramaria rubella]